MYERDRDDVSTPAILEVIEQRQIRYSNHSKNAIYIQVPHSFRDDVLIAYTIRYNTVLEHALNERHFLRVAIDTNFTSLNVGSCLV